MPRGNLKLKKENIKSLNQEQEKRKQQTFPHGLKEIDHIKEKAVRILQNAYAMNILVKETTVQKGKVIIVE